MRIKKRANVFGRAAFMTVLLTVSFVPGSLAEDDARATTGRSPNTSNSSRYSRSTGSSRSSRASRTTDRSRDDRSNYTNTREYNSRSSRYRRSGDSMSTDRRSDKGRADRYTRDRGDKTTDSSGRESIPSRSPGESTDQEINRLEARLRELEDQRVKIMRDLSDLRSKKVEKTAFDSLKDRVVVLEQQTPSANIERDINTLNKQISDIKAVINTIPGVSI